MDDLQKILFCLVIAGISNAYERLRPIEVTNNHYNTFPTDPYAPEDLSNLNGIHQPYTSAEVAAPFEIETEELPLIEEESYPPIPRNRFRPTIRRSENNIFRRISQPYGGNFGSSRALTWREIESQPMEESYKPSLERNPWIGWKSQPRMWRYGRGSTNMMRNSRRPTGQSAFTFSRRPNFAQNIATNHWTPPMRFNRNEWQMVEK